MKKKIFMLAFVAAGFIVTANAQNNAIGLRGVYNGAEISFQHTLVNTNRLEVDAGFWGNGVNLTGIYQWNWDLAQLADGFKWYAGVGAGAGFWGINDKGYFNAGVAGQIGIEYNFNIPLQLSLDYRPALYFLGDGKGGYWTNVALGIRYKF
ncbi:MAG: hypothetical protein LBN27_12520 [Prevotellaceae bacterium]|jgi:hypothetical protein|nr:hypothetical protein [Prevotellaceae bacterium]